MSQPVEDKEKPTYEQLLARVAQLEQQLASVVDRTQLVASRAVTEQRKVDEALRESEERHRLLAETMLQGVVHQDSEGKIVSMNPAAERILGKTRQDFLGSSSVREERDTIKEDGSTFPGLEHPAMVALRTGQTIRDVVMGVFNPKENAYRWIRIDAVPIFRPGEDRPYEVYTVFADITEQKANEEALKKRELQLRVLIENVSSGVALIDQDGWFTQFNQQFLKMFGLSADATVKNVNDTDWSAWKVVDANGQTLHVDDHPVRRAALTRRPVRGQLVGVRNPSGRDLTWMLISAAPILSEDASIEHLICTYHDITDQYRMQEALLDADRRKNDFMAVLSHELRNPLAPIRNSIYVLERAVPGGDQARRALTVIDRQARQLARLVDDLLDVTRITRNKIQLQRQMLDLNDLVRHTVEDQRSLFDQAQVYLEVHPAPRPVFVNADWNRLAQIVGNLLQNAAKFTGRGGVAGVTVRGDTAQKQAVVQVADTGVGMAPEMISRLFQPFIQADSTMDRSKGGLGLGLALVKGLVELHGGEVSARSDGLGKGAEFVVRLPLAAQETTAPRASGEITARGRRRVLIIEDNIDAANSLQEALELCEHEVEVAYNGPDGLAKARQFRPQILLCDIGLPGMDGYQVARAFRADDALKGAFLVALSGYALPEDLAHAKQAGFEQHLAKPPSLEKLEKLLADIPAGIPQ